MRIPFNQLYQQFNRVLLKYGFSAERAGQCARLFAETSRDGVYSHGLNRFPRFIEYIRRGYVFVEAEPVRTQKMGAMEQWDGQLGPGNLNAWQCMERAMAIAADNGLGWVALRNTNHWMRGGTYGWQAAEKGFIGICFTNTLPNMPPWGAEVPLLGNNPLVMAVPRTKGPVVLDMAMTQFSFGKIEAYRREGKTLPVPGGYDEQGRLSTDPAAIEASGRALPVGFWKGSGLSLILDLIASSLAGGLNTIGIGQQDQEEYGLSQCFLAIDPNAMNQGTDYQIGIERTIEALHGAQAAGAGEKVYYPGERTLLIRQENLEKGVPVDEAYWEEVLGM